MTVAAWKVEAAFIQHAHNLRHSAALQEGLEHELKPFLYLDIRILNDHPVRVSYKADRQSERKLAAPGLGKKTRRQTAADGVKLKLGYSSLQPEQQATVCAAGIVDAISIGNEASAHAANVQEWVPIGAVACQTRHVDRQDQAHFVEPDPTDQLLEAAPLRSRSAAQAEIGIDYVDIGFMPSEFVGALPKRVLQPQAFLIAHDLVGRRLTNVDDRLARQMCRVHQFGLHGRSPPRLRRRRRRSDAVELAAVFPKDVLDSCS
jgi:hypothetical protein